MMRIAHLVVGLLCISAAVAKADQFGDVVIDFVAIGNEGNLASPESGDGSVKYSYLIGKHEISRRQIAQANANSEADGTGGSISILVPEDLAFAGRPSQPIGTTWTHAARFANWLNVSSGYGFAYRFETQPGDADYDTYEEPLLWNENAAGYDSGNPMRNTLARYVLPSNDEWVKSAYHDSDAGTAPSYFRYATGSNAPPVSTSGSVSQGTAVYGQPLDQGPADVTKAGGASSYGTVGQNGNAMEWLESYPRSANGTAFLRGGMWASLEPSDMLIVGSTMPVNRGGDRTGFRVTALPHVSLLPIGDFSMNAQLDDMDIDILSEQIRRGQTATRFDLDSNGLVDEADRLHWVQEIANTHLGDADLDGTVGFADFLILSQSFDSFGGWKNGDFDGDGSTQFADFLLLSQNFGAESTRTLAAPEPTGAAIWMAALFCLAASRSGRAA